MTRRGAVLPLAFSLLNSEFNDFLFAPIGEEDDHRTLTLLSAFSREGIDPWHQAAKLKRLPRELATLNLATILAALPDRARSASEAQLAADRLIELLPPRQSPSLAAVRRRVERALARLVSRSLR
jgi:hypothetical protein